MGIEKRLVTFDELARHPEAEFIPADVPLSAEVRQGPFVVRDCAPDLLVLDDVTLVERGGLVWRDMYMPGYEIRYWPKAWRVADWLPGRIIADDRIELVEALCRPVEVEDALHIHIDTSIGHDNFGHFVHDTLAYVDAHDRAVQRFGPMELAATGLRFPNCLDMFKHAFGRPIGSARLRPGKPVLFRRLVVPRRQSILGDNGEYVLSFSSLRKARARIRSAHGLQPTDGPADYDLLLHRDPGRSFAPRSVLQGRDFGNINEAVENMIAHGCVGIEPGAMKLAALVHLFAHARQAIGLHGAGLANIILLPEGRQVLEIRGYTGNWQSIRAVAVALGLQFRALDNAGPVDGHPARIDLDAVQAAIRSGRSIAA